MPKILVVDDSATVRERLKIDLEENHIEVIQATDGLDALKQVKENSPVDLIICDVNMPNMDGITFCEKYLEECGPHNTPIFMLTTEVIGDMKDRAKKIGIKAWITKPYIKSKLIAAIKMTLNKSKG